MKILGKYYGIFYFWNEILKNKIKFDRHVLKLPLWYSIFHPDSFKYLGKILDNLIGVLGVKITSCSCFLNNCSTLLYVRSQSQLPMSGPTGRCQVPISGPLIPLSLAPHCGCRTARAHGGHILPRPSFLLWKANAWARAWGSYTSASLVSALKSKCGSCPLPELGFWAEANARELQLHVPKLGNLDSAAKSWDWITGRAAVT